MIVAGNWKMNLSVNEAIELSNGLLKHNDIFFEEKIIIFPSFLIWELIARNTVTSSSMCSSTFDENTKSTSLLH